MLCALIMAGGKGTRFWPLSTEAKPKQFLNLLENDKSMIQMTVERLTDIIPYEQVFVVTDIKYENLVRQHLPEIPNDNIIIEPVGMNTAPCIALSAMIIEKRFSKATLAVLPSDHLIEDTELFRKTIMAADTYVNNNEKSIITLGMEVNRPETGFGYIKFCNTIADIAGQTIYKVEKFVEKPDVEMASFYMNEGNYLWNGGMFIWKCENIINLTRVYLPNTYQILKNIIDTSTENFKKILFENYYKVDNISVDYGIMEHCEEICVIPCDFGWDDIGSWLSLERYRQPDNDNNILDGQVKLLNSNDNIIVTQTKPVVLCGVENLILVETDDVIMVMKKDKVSKINEIRKIVV